MECRDTGMSAACVFYSTGPVVLGGESGSGVLAYLIAVRALGKPFFT